jgi:hypothetical protein
MATVIPWSQGVWEARVAAHATSNIPADVRETFMFQVGIDKYTSPKVPTLDGCVQDVNDMRALLIKKFNVPATHFLTLTNAQATHEAVIAGFRTQLIENARTHRDATVIFQFSGHGSRVKDRTGTKADGMSSTLVPVDSRDIKGSYFDIVDDEIRQLFEELSQHTTNIIFIIDACHSGNPTRGAGKTRGIPDDERPQPPAKTKQSSTRGEPQRRGGDLAGILPRDQRYVAIAATLPTELAHETKNATNGAMTFHLLKALARSTPDTTYRQLMSEVANNVTTEYVDQHPQVEGDIGRPVFGGSANREDPFIEIQDITNGLMTIKAGLAHGISSGTVVAVYAPNALRLTGNENRLATGTVIAVTPFTSSVKLDTTNTITTQAKVVVVSPDFGSIRTRVAFAKEGATRRGNSASGMTTEVTAKLKNSRSVDLAGEVSLEAANVRGVNWDVMVRQVKFSDWFLAATEAPSSAGTPTPRNGNRQVYCIVGPDGSRPLFGFFRELDNPNAAADIADALERLANQRSLRAINNEASKLNGTIKINVLRVYAELAGGVLKRIVKEEAVDLPKDAQDYPFDQGELFRFEIENQSGQDLFVTFFDISTDGSIQILFPPAGATVAIPKGAKVKPEVILRTAGPPGYESFKIIASTERRGSSDFSFLEQAGVITKSRSQVFTVAAMPDWTTAQVNFVISDKVK